MHMPHALTTMLVAVSEALFLTAALQQATVIKISQQYRRYIPLAHSISAYALQLLFTPFPMRLMLRR